MHQATRWQLDWLVMDPSYRVRDADGVRWIATEVDGYWDSPGPDAELTAKLNRHGTFRTPGWKREQIITLTGRAYCRDLVKLDRARANVLALLSDPDTLTPFINDSNIGQVQCDVALDDEIHTEPLQVVSEPGFEFTIQMVAPDPRKYSTSWMEQAVRLPQQASSGLDFVGLGGGLDFSGDGLTFGDDNTTGFLLLQNRGTAPTFPVYTLHGPLSTPTITAPTGSIRYNGVLNAGQYVVIDPSVPSVLFEGSVNHRHLVNPANFSAFEIPGTKPYGQAGELVIGLSHDGPSTAAGYVEARFRSAWF